MEWVFISLYMFAMFATGIGVCLLKRKIQRKKDKAILHQKVEEAIANITADGKIEGPKGKFVWKNWSRKWINYMYSIPAPRPQSQQIMQTKEIPKTPSIINDD